MRVLVTRPRLDAEQTAARLAALGHEAIIASLLEIRFDEGGEIALNGVQAVMATSANGIRAFATRTKRREVPLYAVGRQSADVARQAGFSEVHDAAGDADALGRLVTASLQPQDGVILYAVGAERRGNLEERLARHGFDVRRNVLYRAVAMDALPQAARDVLASGTLDAVLIFSPRTARIFGALIARENFLQASQKLRMLCISEAAAAEIRPYGFRHVEIALQPDQEALLALLAG